MKKFKKMQIILLLAVVFVFLLVIFMKNVPVRTFYYQTSTACNSNLYGGGKVEYFKYAVLGGGLNKFDSDKSKLEALNIPQFGCESRFVSPEDYTILELYIL